MSVQEDIATAKRVAGKKVSYTIFINLKLVFLNCTNFWLCRTNSSLAMSGARLQI